MKRDVVAYRDVGRDSAITIVLADDQKIVRAALRCVLEAEPSFTVVAEAADLASATRKVLAYKPEVLVLDLHMPDGSTYDAIPRMLDVSPTTRIVILTMDDSPMQRVPPCVPGRWDSPSRRLPRRSWWRRSTPRLLATATSILNWRRGPSASRRSVQARQRDCPRASSTCSNLSRLATPIRRSVKSCT